MPVGPPTERHRAHLAERCRHAAATAVACRPCSRTRMARSTQVGHRLRDAIIEPLDYYEIGSASDRRKRVLELAERRHRRPPPDQVPGAPVWRRAATCRHRPSAHRRPGASSFARDCRHLDAPIRALVINLMKDLYTSASPTSSSPMTSHSSRPSRTESAACNTAAWSNRHHRRHLQLGRRRSTPVRPSTFPRGTSAPTFPPTSPAPRATPAERVSAVTIHHRSNRGTPYVQATSRLSTAPQAQRSSRRSQRAA